MYIDLCDDDNDKYDEIHQTNQCTLLHSESKASTTTEQKIEDQTTSALSNSAKTISRNNPKLQIENQKAQSKQARGHYKAYETSIIFDISLEGSELIIGFNNINDDPKFGLFFETTTIQGLCRCTYRLYTYGGH